MFHKYYIDRAIDGNFVFIGTGNMELRIEVGKLVIKSSGIYTAVVLSLARQSIASQGLLIREGFRSHVMTLHSR